MLKKLVKKILHSFGVDIKRWRPGSDSLGWVKNYNIQTVLDIGANIGQFAKEIRQRLPQAQIYSFEPIEECFQELNKNMVKDNKFKAFPFALGDKEEFHKIHVSTYRPSSSLLPMAKLHEESFPYSKGSVDQEIKIKTLDNMSSELQLTDNLMIKVDVQGYEDKVIKGGHAVFTRAKVVLMETSFQELYEGQPLFDKIYGMLKELGFRYAGGISGKKNPKTGEVLIEDSIFINTR